MMNRDAITYGIIILGCITLVYLAATQDYGKDRTVHSFSFVDYPDQIGLNDSIDFEVLVENGVQTSDYTLKILLNDEEIETRNVALDVDSSKTETFSIQQDFETGQRHKITVLLYEEDMNPESYGSPNYPYYIFFSVDVI